MVGADGPAQKDVAMEYPNLAYVARIVADRHRLADIGGERRVEVSQPLETDAVAVDDARLGDHDQQRVQFLQRFRHPGQPAIAAPRIDGRYADRPVRADVIGRHDVCADRSVQFGKRQARGRYRFAVTKIARQFRQQFGVDGAEQPLDLAAPLWTRDGRVDQADTQIGRSLFEMKAGEVRSVIDVQDVGNAAYRPGRIGLAPNRLSQRERRVERGGRAEENHVACYHARVIVQHRRQPRPHRATAGIEDQDIELGVIGLPDRIGVFGAVPMHQLELVAEGGSTFMCQGQHRRIDPPHDIAHAAIGRHSPLPFADDGGETAMDGHDRWRRFEQRHALDQFD
ncbi:hypothetical protein BSY17_4168 (plasmid) [Sphingobium sp. RAC03]|nr:hypothetical protein BSY17_4168 [Sphingobium sp. RAC03]